MKFADKIRILRKSRGFSQQDLGDRLSAETYGLSRQTVSDWENGKSEPKLENIRSLAIALNVSYDALLDESIDLNDEKVLLDVLNNNLNGVGGSHSPTDTFTFYRNYLSVKFMAIAACLVVLIIFAFDVMNKLNNVHFTEHELPGTTIGNTEAIQQNVLDTQEQMLAVIKIFDPLMLAVICVFSCIAILIFVPTKFKAGQIDKSYIMIRDTKKGYIALNDIESIDVIEFARIQTGITINLKNGIKRKIHLISGARDIVRAFNEFKNL